MDELYLNSIELERHPNTAVRELAQLNSTIFEKYPQLQTLSRLEESNSKSCRIFL